MNTRPLFLKDFFGQKEAKKRLERLIDLGKKRNQSVDHVLLYGYPGTGKTTLANIIANEQGGKLVYTNGGVIRSKSDILKLILSLDKIRQPYHDGYTEIDSKTVLFIDEIHRIPYEMAEELYSMMEDFRISCMVKDTVETLHLPRFTLIGATTELGLMPKPLKDRFKKQIELKPYNLDEVKEIIKNRIEKANMEWSDKSIEEIATRAKSTPRIAISYAEECIDMAEYLESNIDVKIVDMTFEELGIDRLGLSDLDRRYLLQLKGKPKGLNTLSQGLMENKETLTKVIEPYLAQIGFIEYTSRGRGLSSLGEKYLEENKKGMMMLA